MEENRSDIIALNRGRQIEFDIAKVLAIFFMAIIHVGDSISTFDYSGLDVSIYQRFINFIGGPLAAPVFILAMGFGMVYTKHNTPKDFTKRGITLLATGYALNFFREGVLMLAASLMGIETTFAKPLIYSICTIDILQFAGMGFLTIGLLKKLSIKPLHMLGIAFLLQCFGSLFVDKFSNLSPPLNCFVGLLLYTSEYSAFPLFLWLPYLVIGVCFGTKLMQTENKKYFYIRLAIGSSLACLLLSIGYHFGGIDTWSFYSGFENSYYKQNLLSTLWIVSIVCIALSACYGISLKLRGKLELLIKWISSNLNRIYIIHWLVISYSIAILELLDFGRLPQVYIIPAGIIVAIISMVINKTYKRLNQEVKLCRKK